MSVNNVPSNSEFLTRAEYATLPRAEKRRWNNASEAERRQITIEYRSAAKNQNVITGFDIEQDAEQVSPEEQLTRQERRKQIQQNEANEMAKMKEQSKKYADSLYKPVELHDEERKIIEEAAKNDNIDTSIPFYKNKKWQKALRKVVEARVAETREKIKELALAKATDEKQKQKINEEFAKGADFDKEAARIIVKRLRIGDRVENTRVFDTLGERRDARKALGDEADGLRLKVHKQGFLGGLEQRAMALEINTEDQSNHEIAHSLLSPRVGSDLVAQPNEVEGAASKAFLYDNDVAAKYEYKRLGYGVKDDIWKNLAKSLGVATLSALGASAFPTIVTAFAEAGVFNSVTGGMLAYDSASASVTSFNWQGGLLGGGIAGVLSGLLFGKTEDPDVLHGAGIEELFKPDKMNPGKKAYEGMTFGTAENTEKVKYILMTIDSLDATTGQKEELLKIAAGKDGQHILSPEELVMAGLWAMEAKEKPELLPEDPCPPCPEEKPCDCDEKEEQVEEAPEEKPPVPAPQAKEIQGSLSDPNIKVEYTQDTQQNAHNATYNYERKSGEYWFGIVQNMYTTEDGKPIDGSTANAIARKIKDAHNIDRSSANIPKIVKLDYEIEINGKKYKLIDVSDPEKFKRTIDKEESDARVVANTRADQTTTTENTTYGYRIKNENDEVLAERKGFTTKEDRDTRATSDSTYYKNQLK